MTEKFNSIIQKYNNKTNRNPWPDPASEMLDDPMFNAIWECIKSWNINVPEVYDGYCGANGNHARAILDTITTIKKGE